MLAWIQKCRLLMDMPMLLHRHNGTTMLIAEKQDKKETLVNPDINNVSLVIDE